MYLQNDVIFSFDCGKNQSKRDGEAELSKNESVETSS